MKLLARLSGAARGFMRPQASTITTSKELEQSILAELRGSVAGVSVSDMSAMRQRTVATCIRVISEDIASLELRVVRKVGNRSEPLPDHPVQKLLSEQPNEVHTAFEFREYLQRMYEARGNAYALIVTGTGGRIVELLPLHPDNVRPMQDDAGVVTYEYTRPDGRRTTYRRNQILHVRGPSEDGVTGLSTIAWHRETIGEAIAQQRQGTRFFDSGAKPSVVLELEKGVSLGDQARKALREDFAEMYGGVENWGKPAILPEGVKMAPFTISAEDAQYIEQRKFSRSEIAGIWRIPPHKIGDLERATFSNIEHQEIGYVTGSVTPRCRRIEGVFKRDLLAEEAGVVVEHNTDELMRGDAKSRAEALQIKRRNGVISANEWRAMDGMNPRTDPGGDAYIIETNMAPNTGAETAEES